MATEALRLKDVIAWLIRTLTRWSRDHEWGDITISVQHGQIVTIKESSTHKVLPRDQRADTPTSTSS